MYVNPDVSDSLLYRQFRIIDDQLFRSSIWTPSRISFCGSASVPSAS